MASYQPPPTYADVILVDPENKKPAKFNPIWLNWFLGLTQNLTPGGAGSGTVTDVSVITANGLAGSVANSATTPAITLSTTITGLLKGNGTAISAAASGTDYAPPTSGTSILYGNGSGGFYNVTIGTGVSFVAGTLSAAGSGGDVVGPASATDNAVARFDGTTGKLIQNSVVTISDTGATTGVTTLGASTSVTTPIVQASNSAGLSLKNASGTTQMSVGAGGADNMSVNVSTNLNGTNAQIDISPTGTGHVHIKPTGTGSVEVAPTNVGTIDNMTIGATTAKNANFVDLSVTGTLSFDSAQGTVGQVLTSSGTGLTPTWTTPTTGTVTSVSGTAGRVSSTGGTTPVIDLVSGIASAGTTGSASLIPVVTIDTYGRVTSITTAANPQGTVTSVGGTGTVNGLSLSGTVTSSGNLTLGGTLDLSSPPAIGGTSAASGKFTTLGVTALITSTLTSGEVMKFGSTTSGTGIIYMDMFNTSGGMYLGIEGSAGGSLWTNIPAYATALGGRSGGGGISFSANAVTQHMLLTTTGLAVTGTLTTTGTINLLTVGRGGGAVSTNTAVGTSALAANTTGDTSVACGYQALITNTSGYQNTATGYRALRLNLSGINNSSFGFGALQTNSTSNANSAFGASCLSANTAASNSGFGSVCLTTNITGANNCGFGFSALNLNSSGSNNVAVGVSALEANTASNNTGIGYSSGSAITSGAKNVILGSYTGSAAPISATGSNYVVLSDGDGNVRQYFNGSIAIFNGTISPVQATTAGAPAYVKGAIYFDTTLNKLRVGGATAWETITSV